MRAKQPGRTLIVMDEVDGVGAGDRGGLGALLTIIKMTQQPVICICNDRQNRKIQSLLGYCFDLRFSRPSPKQIKTRLAKICSQEGVSFSDD